MKNDDFRTAAAISRACMVDKSTGARWVKLVDFPKRRKGRWPRSEVLEFAAKRAAENARQVRGENSDLRRRKLELQCAKLEQDGLTAKATAAMAARADARDADSVIARTDHAAKLGEFCRLLTDALALWISEVKVLTGDAKLLSEAERLRERVLARLREECRRAAGVPVEQKT